MYLHLMRENEKALRILIAAQQECERIYMESGEPKLIVLPETEAES